MQNNQILKLIIKALELEVSEVLKAYKIIDKQITQEDVHDVLREEHDPKFILLSDDGLEIFLNGLIIFKRGPSPSKKPSHAKIALTNNAILKKLKIALDLKDDTIIEVFTKDDTTLSKYQLSAFFRREGHTNYRVCSDAVLRSFIYGYGKYIQK